jgi:hypothetical protein
MNNLNKKFRKLFGGQGAERTIHGLWRPRGAPPVKYTDEDPSPTEMDISSPWAYRGEDAMLALQLQLAHRLHIRWAKAERAVLEDQNMSAAMTVLLMVSKNFMLTILQHLPPARAETALDEIRKELDGVLCGRGMSDYIYFHKPYEGFWRVREPPLDDRRLPDYRALYDGNVDGPEGEME